MRRLRSKTQARKLHNQGITLILCPNKCYPHDQPNSIKAELQSTDDFDKFLNEFEYYNCNNETGKYTHFYIND